MISLTGSFVIDTTAGTDDECTITIQDHPFKNNDEERRSFSMNISINVEMNNE